MPWLYRCGDLLIDIDGVEKIINTMIGVRQGSCEGPECYRWQIAAVMEAWKEVRSAENVTLRTCRDSTTGTRNLKEQTALDAEMDECLNRVQDRRMATLSNGFLAEEFDVIDLLYADDTCLPFLSKSDLELDLIKFRGLCKRFGLEIHVKKPQQEKKSKTLAVCTEVSKRDVERADMSDIDAGGGCTIHMAKRGKYLGSLISQDGESGADIDNRTSCGWAAFAKLQNVLTKVEVERSGP